MSFDSIPLRLEQFKNEELGRTKILRVIAPYQCT